MKKRGVIKHQIIKDKEILGGSPVIEGTRISVSAVLGQLSVGNGDKGYLKKVYPQLTQDDIDVALQYASEHVR